MNVHNQRPPRLARVWLCRLAFFVLLAVSLPACKREPAPPSATPTVPAPAPRQSRILTAPADTRRNTAAPSTRVRSTPSQPSPAASSDRTDLDITNDVRRAIAGDPTLSPAAKQVLVTTTQGIVRLSGTLPTDADRENLRIAVTKVPGVKSINNRTTVKK